MTLDSLPARLGLLLALAGCTSTGVGNPYAGEVSLALSVDDGDAPIPSADAQELEDAGQPAQAVGVDEGEPLLPRGAVRHALVAVRELRLLPCDRDVAKVIVRGPFVFDLVAGRSEPALAPVPVPEGGLCGIDAPLRAATQPASLAGRSLLFEGERADGVSFLVYADVRATLRVRATVAWDQAETPTLLWVFRPRRWLGAREIDALQPSDWDGGKRSIVIDADRHPVLFLAIRRRIAGKSTLYADRHGDGVAGPDDPVVGLGSDDAD